MPTLPQVKKLLAAPDVALPHIRDTLAVSLAEIEVKLPAGLPKVSATIRGAAIPQPPKIETFLKGPAGGLAAVQAALGLGLQGTNATAAATTTVTPPSPAPVRARELVFE